MIVVTGTKRSGTSLWMQVLKAAGFPIIGKEFPGDWDKSIRQANPNGFFESRLRQGVYFATNPDPETGEFFRPSQVTRHGVKIFIPGLIRTDFGYIGAVIASMRSWREYGPSLQRLHGMEDAYRKEAEARGEKPVSSPFPDEETEARVRAGRIPPALEWWFENYDLIRDLSVRRYPFHMTTYDRMLEDPEQEIRKVLTWLDDGNLEPALAVVNPGLRTQKTGITHEPLVEGFEEVFDALYDSVNRRQPLTAPFIQKLNESNQALMERWKELYEERVEAAKIGAG